MPLLVMMRTPMYYGFHAGAMPFQITVTKTYNTTNLFEDIKGLYKVAGVKGQPVAFIFTDNEVKEEGFLEYINQILMTGEVAGLFQKDELDAIVNDIRPIMKAESPGQFLRLMQTGVVCPTLAGPSDFRQ